MRNWVFIFIVVAFSAPHAVQADDIRIASWNIKHLGWNNDKNFEALGYIGAHFDLIAVQEVMKEDGVRELEKALEYASDEPWGVISSHLIGRGSYKEMYSFVYRESRVRYLDGAVVYLDATDRYAREPFAARFASADGSVRFVAATVHILYGDSQADRIPEIRALDGLWGWLEEVFPEDDNLLLMGDFNLPPSHPAWQELRDDAVPVITDGATTLSTIDGRYANLYDLIWVSRDHSMRLLGKGIDKFPQRLGMTHETARDEVSDHVPVYLVVDVDGELPERRIRDYTGKREIIASASASQNTPTDGAIEVRGNRNSQIYHLPECPAFSRVAERNRVAFASEEAAVSAGYREAGNCP
jgi:endonuclease/exonuclease/phosphatase family metal-dependent hydrolase